MIDIFDVYKAVRRVCKRLCGGCNRHCLYLDHRRFLALGEASELSGVSLVELVVDRITRFHLKIDQIGVLQYVSSIPSKKCKRIIGICSESL